MLLYSTSFSHPYISLHNNNILTDVLCQVTDRALIKMFCSAITDRHTYAHFNILGVNFTKLFILSLPILKSQPRIKLIF